MFYIIISKNEGYRDAADLIVESCQQFSVAADIVEIGVLKNTLFKSKDVIFFLTNDQNVGNLVAGLLLKGVIIINHTYLIGNRAKSYAQQRILSYGVTVPRHLSGVGLYQFEDEKLSGRLGFPLYVKSESHAQGAFKITRGEELRVIIAKHEYSVGWYLEEAADAPNRHLEKLYWVAGSCFKRDGRQAPRIDVVKAMNTIGKTFSFDIFSADFVLDEAGYWCIDVNPAPGFFGSKAARESLVVLMQARLTYKHGGFAGIYQQSIERHGGLKSFILHKMNHSAGARTTYGGKSYHIRCANSGHVSPIPPPRYW